MLATDLKSRKRRLLPLTHLHWKSWTIGSLARRWSSLILPLIVAIAVILPIVDLSRQILHPDEARWQHWWETSLPPMIENTLRLVFGVGIGTFGLGVGFAWLVTAYQFPGRALFDRLLILPLAVPGFIMGFVFMGTFDYAGPVQTQWRVWFGDAAWFPDILSGSGVILVMTLVLYPYVYLLARAAFREQAASTFEAAQIMGYSRWQTFLRLVLPLARPSIAAGVTLAMLEALTDYGTVRFFGYPTLSEGVVRTWEGSYDREAATELATLLLVFAFGMIILERTLRGRRRYFQTGGASRRPLRVRLHGWRGWLATGACTFLLGVAFILPLSQLVMWASAEIEEPTVGIVTWDLYLDYVQNSARLASIAAGIIIGLAVVVAHGVRAGSVHGKRLLPRFIARLVTLGYAMPSAVVAAGVLLLVAPIDHEVTDFFEQHLGRTNPDLLFTGTTTSLMYAYVVRFMAVGFSSVDASLEKIKPSMEEAARTMGARPFRVLWRIHLPLISTGIAAGAILVFVDVMKEIPATLMLRPPFSADTLALWAYFLAAESFWQAASIPALSILVVGLLPVLLLMRIGDKAIEKRAE